MNNEPDHLSIKPAPIAHRVQALTMVLVLTLAASLPLILSGNVNGRAAADDYNYHWIAIQQFAIEWPSPDVGDYHSATTPGYHLILAPLVRSGLEHAGAQIVAHGWTLAFFGLLCWSVSRSMGRSASVICLPMIVSMYTLYPGVWLLPDNAGWFFVLAILLLSLRDRVNWATWAASGALLAALVLVRQVHIWIAGLVWLSAWLGSGADTPSDLRSFFGDLVSRGGRTLLAMACTIPAVTVLAWFVMLWGGLVPPMFQGNHQGPNPATPGFILLQLAVLSVFFSPILLPRMKAVWAHHWRWVALSVLVGIACATIPVSSYSVDAGRYSGWWNLVKQVPEVAGRSPVFVLGAVAGALVVPLWLSLVSRRDAWVWIGVLVAFIAAQSANHASWQRYHEPLLLVMLALIIARSRNIDAMRVRVLIGMAAMCTMMLILNIMSLATSEPYTPIEDPFGAHAQLAGFPTSP
jgi:hypothetical protein